MSDANAPLAMPYPGLRPFEAEDEPLFFGREAQVSAMLRQLEDDRFVAVVGSSGSGKSSLVRAGLLPAVHEGFLLGTTDWLTTIIKPGHQPYERLVRAFSRATSVALDDQLAPTYDCPLTADEAATLIKLRRTDHGLITVIDELAISRESRVIVVVDQFEELFAFRRAGANRDSVASRDEAAAFVGMLLRSASEQAGRVWVIITMRSDFIGDCEAFLGLPEQISRSQFLVPRLDRSQMEDAITRPALFEEGAFKTFTFEAGLVNHIINGAGDRPDQLPLMQHALMRTWKHAVARAGAYGPVILTPEAYEAAGGIEMALSLHADAAWDQIKDDPKKAHITRCLFLLLCDISPDGQITRRRPQVAEVQAVTGASVAEIEQVVRVFQQDDRNFLLSSPPLTVESYLDISHEALLRRWQRFAGGRQEQERRDASELPWQEQERRDAAELRRVADLASLRKQGEGGQLPAQDLERIDRWKERVSAEWARRYVTKEAWGEAISFIEESRAEVKREEEQRQKQAQQKRALVRWVAIILIFVSTWSTFVMVKSRDSERAALTRSFVRTIGVSDDNKELAADEQAALWELAELDPADTPVREKVIDHWFQSGESIGRAFKRQAQGLHAAVGLNLAVRNHAASKATEMAYRLAKALGNSKETDSDRISSLGQALAALSTRMDPKGAATAAARGAQVLPKALEKAPDSDRMSSLGQALAALTARMEPKEAASVAGRGAQVLAKALEKAPDSDRMSSLGEALAALATRIGPYEAATVADRLAKAMENSEETDSHRMSSLGQALAALTAQIREPKEAASVAARGAQVLAKALEKAPDRDRMSSLGQALAALTARMEPKEAATVADRLAKAMENSTETDSDRMSSLGQALAALTARMEPKETASVAARGAQVLAKALEKAPDRVSSLGEALAALATRMEPKEAATVAARGAQVLAKALENSTETDARDLSSLRWSLGGLARLIPPARQTQLAALSNMLLEEVSDPSQQGEEGPERRKQLADLYALLDAQDLAKVLKWPFCVGEAEKIALAELEKKEGRKFGGDIWKFVEQAPSLGIEDLDAPPKRPKMEEALKELKSVATEGEVPRQSGGE